MRLLFTCVGRRVELLQAFAKAAERKNIELQLYGVDCDNTAPALQFCDKALAVPRVSEDSYIPALLSICRRERIDALIPTIDTDLMRLAEARSDFASVGTTAIVSDPDTILTCMDKRDTGALFNSAGLKSPLTVDDLSRYRGGFPAFIKPNCGSSSIDAFRVEDAEELEGIASRIPGYIVQPFIDGVEYTVDVLCNFDGSPVYVTPRIRLATRTGEVLKTQIRQDAVIVEEVLELIDILKPRGPIAVQLIRETSTGEDYFIEVNPRFGGGAPLSIKAGADEADAILRMVMGEYLQYMPCAAEDGAVYSRFDQSVKTQ